MTAGTERAVGVEHVLGPVSEIPAGEGRAYGVAGRQVAVFRLRDGTVRALDAVCPHRGGPLADGQTTTSASVCPLHAHVFDLGTGACRSGQDDVASYAVRVEDGQVVVVLPGTSGSAGRTG